MIGMEIENEVYEDFKECLGSLDFKHLRATSPEFMTAINMGTLWRLIHKANKKDMELMAAKGEVMHEEEKAAEYEEEHHEEGDMSQELKEIKDKLEQVEASYNRYENTKRDIYHKFAMEDLHQAELMIKDTGEKMTGTDYQNKMKCYEDWYISLHHKLNGVK